MPSPRKNGQPFSPAENASEKNGQSWQPVFLATSCPQKHRRFVRYLLLFPPGGNLSWCCFTQVKPVFGTPKNNPKKHQICESGPVDALGCSGGGSTLAVRTLENFRMRFCPGLINYGAFCVSRVNYRETHLSLGGKRYVFSNRANRLSKKPANAFASNKNESIPQKPWDFASVVPPRWKLEHMVSCAGNKKGCRGKKQSIFLPPKHPASAKTGVTWQNHASLFARWQTYVFAWARNHVLKFLRGGTAHAFIPVVAAASRSITRRMRFFGMWNFFVKKAEFWSFWEEFGINCIFWK